MQTCREAIPLAFLDVIRHNQFSLYLKSSSLAKLIGVKPKY